MVNANLVLPRDAITDFCRRHHIRKLALFGSALRDDFRPDSDVDVLVEFEPGHIPGFAFFAMQDELSELIGRKVDLQTRNFLSRYFRDKIDAEAEIQYVADREGPSASHAGLRSEGDLLYAGAFAS
jgi:predicted nucleotidyltransferase